MKMISFDRSITQVINNPQSHSIKTYEDHETLDFPGPDQTEIGARKHFRYVFGSGQGMQFWIGSDQGISTGVSNISF